MNVINLKIPPLRERREDIILLAQTFLDEFKRKFPDRKDITINDERLEKLVGYSWPGNVRELKNLIERVVILAEENEIDYLVRSQRAQPTNLNQYSHQP